MPEATAQFEKWVSVFRPSPASAVRLACLPHAGGSASFFFPVAAALAPRVEVLAVQYPGRQTRRHEPGIDNIPEYVDQIFAVLRHPDDRPLALFGHSMGAVLAYEVALRMQEAGMPSPVRLFASGRRAPSRYRSENLRSATGAEILAELRTLSGPNQAILADSEILAASLPAIRSDYTAIESYRHDPSRLLDCPVTVLTGDNDPRTTLDEAHAWQEHTTGPTDVRVFSGGHFFHVEHSAEVIALLSDSLSGEDAGTGRQRHGTSIPGRSP